MRYLWTRPSPKRRKHNAIIRTKRAGSAYIGLCIALGVIAVNSGNNLLYLTTAVMLGYMLASGIAGRRNIRSVQVSIDFPGEVYAQVPCAVAVHVTNTNRLLPAYLLEVGLWSGEEFRSVLFPIVQPGETATKTLFTSFPKRGRCTVRETELSSVYPFDFFERFWPVRFTANVTVFPYPLRCDPATVFAGHDDKDEGKNSSASPLSESDIVGIRPYLEGDSMKRVHWKSSARTGKLKTRVYEGTASEVALLDIDRLIEKNRERGLSQAAFLISRSLRTGEPVGMRYGEEVFLPARERAHKLDLLTRLALS